MAIAPQLLWAAEDNSYISESNVASSFKLSADGVSTSFLINSKDYKGVIRALIDVQNDIGKVTDHKPNIIYDKIPLGKDLVIVGTIGQSALIDQLVKNRKLDVSTIKGK